MVNFGTAEESRRGQSIKQRVLLIDNNFKT
jgi:hypothetical protein